MISRRSKTSLSFLALFYLGLVLNAVAQKYDHSENYIQDLQESLALDISLNNHYKTFSIGGPNFRYDIAPNSKNSLRLEANYRFLSLGFAISPAFLPGNGDEDLKGKTQSFNLGTTMVLSNFILGAEFHNVQGHYLRNTSDFINWQEGDPYIQFPNHRMRGIDFLFAYTLNQNFSYRSIYTQTERQLKSAGSFLPLFEFDYYSFGDIQKPVNSQTSQNFEFILCPGYAYNYVLGKHFYASLSAHLGGAYLHNRILSRLTDGDQLSRQNNWAWAWRASASIGYNGPIWYAGIRYDGADLYYRQEGSRVRNEEYRLDYSFFLGYRFSAPEWIKKPMDFAENLIPFL